MNEELLSYSSKKGGHIQPDLPEEEIMPKPAKSSGKLSTIFLVVLGLHIIVIVGVSVFHLLRGQAQPEIASTEETITTPAEPAIASTPAVATPLPEMSPVTTSKASSAVPAPQEWTAPVQPVSVQTQQVKQLPITSTASAGTSKTYSVAKGDTLNKIARKHGVSVQQLKQANQLKSDLIRVGQSLKIPSTSQVVASTVTTSSSTTVGSGESYKVVKGDTLTSIARRHSTTANKLAELNNISDPTRLRIGMMLKLPRQNVNSASTLEAENLSPQAKPFRAPVMNTDMAMLRPAENS